MLVLNVSCYLVLLSLPIIADEIDQYGLPKINKYKEYYIYMIPAAGSLFIHILANLYSSLIQGSGIARAVKGLRTRLFRNVLIVVSVTALFTFAFLLSVEEFKISLLAGEAILYLNYIILLCAGIIFTRRFITKTVKELISDDKKRQIEQEKSKKVVRVTAKGIYMFSFQCLLSYFFCFLGQICFIYIGLIFNVLNIVFSIYYVYVVNILYRASSIEMKGFICLVAHPLITELFLTVLKFQVGNSSTIHPYFEQ